MANFWDQLGAGIKTASSELWDLFVAKKPSTVKTVNENLWSMLTGKPAPTFDPSGWILFFAIIAVALLIGYFISLYSAIWRK